MRHSSNPNAPTEPWSCRIFRSRRSPWTMPTASGPSPRPSVASAMADAASQRRARSSDDVRTPRSVSAAAKTRLAGSWYSSASSSGHRNPSACRWSVATNRPIAAASSDDSSASRRSPSIQRRIMQARVPGTPSMEMLRKRSPVNVRTGSGTASAVSRARAASQRSSLRSVAWS